MGIILLHREACVLRSSIQEQNQIWLFPFFSLNQDQYVGWALDDFIPFNNMLRRFLIFIPIDKMEAMRKHIKYIIIYFDTGIMAPESFQFNANLSVASAFVNC